MEEMNIRIKNDYLKKKITSDIEAAKQIKKGDCVAFGGQVSVGAPKRMPQAICDVHNLEQGFFIDVISTSNNNYIDELLSQFGMIRRRFPMNDSRNLAKQFNSGEAQYVEQQMNKVINLIESGRVGSIDFAVVEALSILEDGSLIPTTSIGLEPYLLEKANHIIIEINCAYPIELCKLHDIFNPSSNSPIPISFINERIGKNSICIDVEKVSAIIFTNEKDKATIFPNCSPEQEKVAQNLIDFLIQEAKRQNWTQMPPIQTGFGNLANCIVDKMVESPLDDISFFCGHLQEANMKLLLSDKCTGATCSSIQLNECIEKEVVANIDLLSKKLVIRNSNLINNSEVISRFKPITLTTGIEMDIYGNVNLSHISGSKVVNGLGGGANFSENAGLSIFMIVSEAKEGRISSIVPMVTHQDICEHDIDVVVTENGVADLRGLTDIERAETIIDKCSGSYKKQLMDYLEKAKKTGGHHPVCLEEAFSWHINLAKNGTMRKE